jgi:diguanylate cyclase (GGDEF)-like protein
VLPIITHSLKTRLTLLFGVLTLGLIIAFTTYLYYFSSQEIMRSAQRNIDNLTRSIVQVLENHVPTIDLEQIDNTWISDKIEQFRTQFQLSDDIQIQVFSIDDVLKIIASMLNSCMRETDFVARYGGEEFLIILPDTQEQSFILAEKLRHVISTLAFPFGQQLTVSIGLSIVNSADNAPEDAVR